MYGCNLSRLLAHGYKCNPLLSLAQFARFRFHTDTERELEMVREHALKNGAFDAHIAENWEKGGEGAVNLAQAVVKACKTPSTFKVGLAFSIYYD